MLKLSFFRGKKQLIILGVTLLVVVGFFASKAYIFPEKKYSQTAEIKRGNLSEKLTLSGTIDAKEKADIQFQTSGLISWMGVKQGDTVKKYQAIASLDQRQLQNTLQQDLNTYMYNRDAFDQSVENTEGQVLSDALKRLVDQAQQTMNNTVLNVQLQTLLLQLATVTSPINGIVVDVPVPYAGVNIVANKTIASIVNPDTVYFNVSADQTEVVGLHPGDKADIVLDSFPDKTITATVSTISFTPKKDETGTVYEVKMDLGIPDNKDYEYKIGMTGDASFVTKQVYDVFYVPTRFVKTDENSKHYIIAGPQKKKTYVTVGIEDEENTQISGTIAAGELVYD